MITALLLALQVGVPSPRADRPVPRPPCVTCHQWASDSTRPAPLDADSLEPAQFLYPYRYAPGARVVVTRPRSGTIDLRLSPHKTAGERLVPRLERRKPPPTRSPRTKPDGSPGVTLRR